MGCESSGFFSLFNGQSAQCGPVNNQIQQMRGNLDQITTSLERLRSGGIGGADRENQRRSVLTALAQNNCGPQYAAAARGPGNFIDNLFGNNSRRCRRPAPISARRPAPSAPSASAPATALISRSRSPPYQARFPDDETDLQGAVPGDGSDAVHLPQSRRGHQPGGLDQRPALFRRCRTRSNIRTEFNPSCACKAAGQTWSDALKVGRRQGRRRTAGRHHRHRGEREEDAAAAAQPKASAATPPPRRAPRPPAPPPAAGRDTPHPPPIRPPPPPTRTSRSARSVRPSSRRSR